MSVKGCECVGPLAQSCQLNPILSASSLPNFLAFLHGSCKITLEQLADAGNLATARETTPSTSSLLKLSLLTVSGGCWDDRFKMVECWKFCDCPVQLSWAPNTALIDKKLQKLRIQKYNQMPLVQFHDKSMQFLRHFHVFSPPHSHPTWSPRPRHQRGHLTQERNTLNVLIVLIRNRWKQVVSRKCPKHHSSHAKCFWTRVWYNMV